MKIVPFAVASIDFILFFALRSTYSYVKPCLKDLYHLSDLFLALMDVSLYLGVATGYLLRFCMVNPQNINKSFQISIISLFVCITILSLWTQTSANVSAFQKSKLLLFVVIYFLGIPTSCFESFLFSKVKESYKGENAKVIYDCWSGCAHLGKAMAFVLMPSAIIDLHLSWSQALMSLNLLLLVSNLSAYFYLRSSIIQNQQQNPRIVFNAQQININQEEKENRPITHTEFLEFIPVLLFKHKALVYVLLIGCSKALAQNILMWLPAYLFSHNYQKLASVSGFVYAFPIIFGSFIIGLIYRHQANRIEQVKDSFCFLLGTAVIAIGGFAILTCIQMNQLHFIIMVSLQGMIAGGFTNILLENESFSQNFNQREKQMLVTVAKTSMHVGIAVLDLVIGVSLQLKYRTHGKNMHNYDVIFQILLVVSIICLGLFAYWYKIIIKKPQNKEALEENSV